VPAANPKGRWAAEAERRLSAALPQLSQAAGEEVVGVIGAHDPLAAVRDALNLMGFDEVIVSTLAARGSRWLRLGLPRKIRELGVPVTVVTLGPITSEDDASNSATGAGRGARAGGADGLRTQ
jgi:hypothetical protein